MRSILDQLLQFSGVGNSEATALGMGLALLFSAIAAALVHYLYDHFYGARSTGSQIQRSFLLLGPSITLLFIAVQLSLPLSLGLLGALSIVRFRVPIKEPEEVGFLMVVVASSISCATYAYGLLVMLLVLVVAVLLIKQHLGGVARRRDGGNILLRVEAQAHRTHSARLEELLRSRFGTLRLEHLCGEEGWTKLNYEFGSRGPVDWGSLEGDLRELGPVELVSVVYSRPGVL